MTTTPYLTQASAHRGDNHDAPENTLPAFALAIEKGAGQIEFDVRTTRDGRVIVMHDATVDRTTSGTGAVADLTFEELRRLDAGSWKGEQFAGTRVPALEEVLAIVPAGVLVNIQLYLAPEQTGQVVAAIQRYGLLEQAFLTCGREHLQAAREIEPAVRICFTENPRGADSDYPDRTIAVGAQYLQIWGWSEALPAAVQRLHEAGVTVNFFGTEDPALVRQLIEARVDYILTNHLDVVHGVMAEYGLAPRATAH